MEASMTERLGVQSWCFREFKTSGQVVEGLKACGVSRLEICGVHIDVAKNAEATLKAYENAGITISALGVCGFGKDEVAARKAFEFAVMAGFPAIGADLHEGGLPLAERLCAEYGKKIAVHNHGRKHALGSVAALEKLFAESGPNIGLCLDTAWMLDSGEEPVEIAEKFKERLYGVHIKDFVFDRAGKEIDVVAGTGNLKLEKLAAFLKRIDYKGYLTIEYEGEKENPVPSLSECVRRTREALASA